MAFQNIFRNYFKWGILLLFGALVFAAAGSWPQLFGHTQNEIEPIVLEKSTSCAGTSCHLDCNPGYAVFSGSCSSSETDGHWNLIGANSDHKGWDCVDGSATPATTITIDLTCVKTYFDSVPNPFCGNFVVENPEVCDGPNILDIDCTDYFLNPINGGTQLCNGAIGACATNTCNGLNISKCEYCDSGACIPPQIECANSTPQNIICALDCTPFGGPKSASGNTLDSVSFQTNWYYPPGPPLPPSIPGPGPGTGICGDGILGNSPGEVCEPPDQYMQSCGAACMQCPVGDPTAPNVMYYGLCDGSCQCIPPSCGGGQQPLACNDPGPGPGPGPGTN